MPEQESDILVLSGTETGPEAFPADLKGRWYVAHTRSRQEKVLAEELSRFSIYNYLPLARRVTRSSATGRISRSLVPVFPGYVFFNGSEEQRYLALRTNRVANVLNVADQEQLIAELIQVHRLLASSEDFAVANRLNAGDWVRIVAGPLSGLEGTITGYPGRFRLCINVTILGQCVSVEVGHDIVERIDPPAYAGRVSSKGRWVG